jgi:hypothetical protein
MQILSTLAILAVRFNGATLDDVSEATGLDRLTIRRAEARMLRDTIAWETPTPVMRAAARAFCA